MEPKSRNDALLSTGLSSAAERRSKARAEEQRKKREGLRAGITPGGEILVAWIEAERALVIEDLAKIPMTIETTEESVKSHIVAVKMHLEFLDRLKRKTRTVLREVKAADKKAAEESDKAAPEAWKAEAAK